MASTSPPAPTKPAAKSPAKATVPTLAAYSLNQPDQLAGLAQLVGHHIQQHRLYTDIQGKKHVNVEGWQFAGAMLGLVPLVEKVEDLSTHTERTFKGYGGKPDTTIGHLEFRATVGLLDLRSQQLVGRGIASCCNFESKKRGFDPYAVESMAQTRATGKAFRLLLAWVMQAGGYATTPAEEMPDAEPETYAQVVANPPAAAPVPAPVVAYALPDAIKAVLTVATREELAELWPHLEAHRGEPVFDLACTATKMRWPAPAAGTTEQVESGFATRAQRDQIHKALASHKNDGYRIEALHRLSEPGLLAAEASTIVDKSLANLSAQPARVDGTAQAKRPPVVTPAPSQTVALATSQQKQTIIELLNHPVITRQEKTKMLLNLNTLSSQRAEEAMGKLGKAITDRQGTTAVAA